MTVNNNLLTQTKTDVQTSISTSLQYGGIGEGDNVPTAADTVLELEVFRDAFDTTDTSTPGEIEKVLIVRTTEANNNTILEVGAWTLPILVVDNCDATTSWSDSADMTVSLNNTTFYEGTGSLNLTKDGTSSTTASTSKTTTSRNFTSGILAVTLYVDDAATLAKLASSNCLRLRLGSDSSNYYEWAYDVASLAVGKNFFGDLTSANADTTTGTPVITACDYTGIVLTSVNTSDTWVAGKILMDDIKIIGQAVYLRSLINSFAKDNTKELYITFTITEEVVEV